ncbi:hypothetical protein [Olleya sp. HaHaR_3_96]|uniref:hypothetical protein n=1 Tax=Olleya sp. HaHaR_3_96 TaxID=2745560 RepID=UPI001C4E929C|nr:hypothetical protein [Olleya sp. HaHaR_3_96]QXP58628.1 hypothetical protein H0I26_11960 [Olleya sp. HaHaR_3_96]
MSFILKVSGKTRVIIGLILIVIGVFILFFKDTYNIAGSYSAFFGSLTLTLGIIFILTRNKKA